MDDKCIMENILLTEKGVCDLFLHGTIESSTANVHQAFNTALNDSLCMQDELYKKMAQKGWYPTEQAEEQKIQKVKQKFSNSSSNSSRPKRNRGVFTPRFLYLSGSNELVEKIAVHRQILRQLRMEGRDQLAILPGRYNTAVHLR